MPAKETTPVTVEVQPVQTENIDTFQVVTINIHMPHLSKENSIDIQYVGGLDDGQGNVDWKIDKTMTLSGTEFDALVGEAPSGATVYSVIKNAVYAKLIAEGVISGSAIIS